MPDKEYYQERAHELREQYREVLSQKSAEGWFPVIRDGSGELEARPVDRQGDREEGTEIESSEWLIREPNGETYTVTDETFQSEFNDSGQFHSRRFMLDLSWDDIDADNDDVPTIPGADCHVYVDATIHVPTDSIVSMDVLRVEYEHERTDRDETYEALPMEVMYDSDKVFDVEDDDDD